jgi:hypothetical protein
MSFNGSGTFVLNTGGYPYVTGTVISSTNVNALLQDIANGLSICTTRDGQMSATGPLHMGTQYVDGGATLGFSLNNVLAMTLTSTGLRVVNQTAFRAYRSTGAGNQTSGSTCLWDTIAMQQGGTNYVAATGTYTCPAAGIYMFGANFNVSVGTPGSTLTVDIYQNANRVGGQVIDIDVGGVVSGGCAMTCILAAQGDTVNVQLGTGGPFSAQLQLLGGVGATCFFGFQAA